MKTYHNFNVGDFVEVRKYSQSLFTGVVTRTMLTIVDVELDDNFGSATFKFNQHGAQDYRARSNKKGQDRELSWSHLRLIENTNTLDQLRQEIEQNRRRRKEANLRAQKQKAEEQLREDQERQARIEQFWIDVGEKIWNSRQKLRLVDGLELTYMMRDATSDVVDAAGNIVSYGKSGKVLMCTITAYVSVFERVMAERENREPKKEIRVCRGGIETHASVGTNLKVEPRFWSGNELTFPADSDWIKKLVHDEFS